MVNTLNENVRFIKVYRSGLKDSNFFYFFMNP